MSKAVNGDFTRRGRGRPAGSATRIKGLSAFCRATGYSVTYAHEVLTGKRACGAPLRRAWARHQAMIVGGASK